MNTTISHSGAGRRLLVGLGTAAIALGMVGLAPAAANAATTQVITGKVVYSANPSKGLAKTGAIRLYSDACNLVKPRAVTWKGNTYRISVRKAGTYRVVYGNSSKSGAAPYGLSSRSCKVASRVKLGTGKTAGRSLEVRANARIQIVNKSRKSGESFRVYEAGTNRLVSKATTSGTVIHPGKYKVAKIRIDSKGRRVIVQVFGTTSKSLSKGKTVTLPAALPTKVSFDSGSTSTPQAFPATAEVSFGGGTAMVGQQLDAMPTGFPAGTAFTFVWSRSGGAGANGVIAGATSPSYTPTADDAGATLTVTVTATKAGYLTRTFTSSVTVAPGVLTVVSAQTEAGLGGLVGDLLGATVGVPIVVTPATFSQSGVDVSYEWTRGGDVVDTDASYTPLLLPLLTTIHLEVTYSKPGYEDVVVVRNFGILV